MLALKFYFICRQTSRRERVASIPVEQSKSVDELFPLMIIFVQCFPDCHRGVRNRTVICVTVSSRMEMDGCDPPMPPTEERCFANGPCNEWVPEPWSAVSKQHHVGKNKIN